MSFTDELGPIHHYGYAVKSLDDALAHWVSDLGAGPFFRMDDLPFDSVESYGQPSVFEHSMALGKWGQMFVELQEIHQVQPDSLAPLLGVGAEPVVSHIAFASVDPGARSARLEELGMPIFLTAKVGPIMARYHEAPSLGHGIEIHDKNEAFLGLFQLIDAASVDWDGSDPVRPFPAMS